MGRESFEDQGTAALLNRAFVAVKVDREERPDIDAVYMAVCQAMTGSGGWPLTILMTPEQKPFWAGTYLPPHSRYGQTGLAELLGRVKELWKTQRAGLLRTGDEIAAHISRREEPSAAEPGKKLLHAAAGWFRRAFDKKNGGFGGAPKFPTPHNLLFLMEYARLENAPDALHMAETTLTQMARGGLFDQLGGGFSRYSTDERWMMPHFEKMLYDNALLSISYLEAFGRTGRSFFRTVARRTLNYVLSELTGPHGEFYCGQDADSGGEEGGYYLLTPDEVRQILGPEDGKTLCEWYNITDRGNFEGKSIPNLLKNAHYEQEPGALAGLRDRLCGYRRSRAELHRDDKALTAWNAWMIVALARAYRVLEEPVYLDAARRARNFIRSELTGPDGRLRLRWRDGEAAHAGQLDDYAFYILALLELYSANFDVFDLEEAARLAGELVRHFEDKENGGFFLTAADARPLIARPKEVYDGAMPSGNSVAGLALVRLWKLTGEAKWREAASRQLAFLAGHAWEYPAGHSFALLAFCEELYPSKELTCAAAEMPRALPGLTRRRRLHTILKTRGIADRLAKIAPFTASYPVPETGAAYYLCQNGACAAPLYDLEELERLL